MIMWLHRALVMKVTGSLSTFKSFLSTRVPPVLQVFPLQSFTLPLGSRMGTAVAQCLRCCATNRKVAGSIPAGVIGNFH